MDGDGGGTDSKCEILASWTRYESTSSFASSREDDLTCQSCAKVFSRTDLLRRHITREAKLEASPSMKRKKACYHCTQSKTRCDLEVPSCGNCVRRNKECYYGVNSGNPNYHKIEFKEGAQAHAHSLNRVVPPKKVQSSLNDAAQGFKSDTPDKVTKLMEDGIKRNDESYYLASRRPSEAAIDVQTVAQLCAQHFCKYPALMVFANYDCHVPSLFHRPWLAHSPFESMPSLARARTLLTECLFQQLKETTMLDEDIYQARQTLIYMATTCVCDIVESYEDHRKSSDLDILSSTAALWFLSITLLSSDIFSSSTTNSSENILDHSLLGLSDYSKLLHQRLEARSAVIHNSFLNWGFEETIKRTLFASYSLLTLQRFNNNNHSKSKLDGGTSLLYNLTLPATTAQFGANNQLEWQHHQQQRCMDHRVALYTGYSNHFTVSDLLRSRKNGSLEEKERIATNLDNSDEFTKVCLTIIVHLDHQS